jgi:dTDP-4-dehydrorhamnose 3,5-epimerase
VIFRETEVPGAFLIEPARVQDERGFFARLFTPEEFAARGLDARVAQVALSHNRQRGTLRGLHYQAAPHAQAKLVRCTRGAVWDVIVDLRPASPAYRRWLAVELTAHDRLQLFVPAGCAHGFVTLEDDSELLYQLSAAWQPAAERGVRWDDPALAIAWPLRPAVISPRDAALPGVEAAIDAA